MKHIFDQFKRLHPNNKEQYNPTPDNCRRWIYHIQKAIDRNNKVSSNQVEPNVLNIPTIMLIAQEKGLYINSIPSSLKGSIITSYKSGDIDKCISILVSCGAYTGGGCNGCGNNNHMINNLIGLAIDNKLI